MRNKITLACTECKQRNYNTTKNKKNNPDRIELRKFCKFCGRKHSTRRLSSRGNIMANNNETISRDGKDTKVENKTSKPEQRKERKGIIGYFTGVKQEMAKVVWPTRAELTKDTVVVFGVCIFFSLLFWGMDTGFFSSAQEASRNYAIEIG